MEKLICFAHGKESGPWGSKILHLAEIARRLGWTVMSPDYSGTQDFDERLEQLIALRPRADRLLLCGSSMGGYVSAHACAALQPDALMLLAPALYYPGQEQEPEGCPADTVVIHGWQDDIIPVDTSLRFARARRAALHLVNDGHRLMDSLDLIGNLLEAQLRRQDAQ